MTISQWNTLSNRVSLFRDSLTEGNLILRIRPRLYGHMSTSAGNAENQTIFAKTAEIVIADLPLMKYILVRNSNNPNVCDEYDARPYWGLEMTLFLIFWMPWFHHIHETFVIRATCDIYDVIFLFLLHRNIVVLYPQIQSLNKIAVGFWLLRSY